MAAGCDFRLNSLVGKKLNNLMVLLACRSERARRERASAREAESNRLNTTRFFKDELSQSGDQISWRPAMVRVICCARVRTGRHDRRMIKVNQIVAAKAVSSPTYRQARGSSTNAKRT